MSGRRIGWALLLGLAAARGGMADEPRDAAARGTRQLAPALSVDLDEGVVRVDATVVLREGPLEVLLCPPDTKEHESILAADVDPRMFQLALLLAGAEPGSPARFDTDPPTPPSGQKLDIQVEYADAAGKEIRRDIREWVQQQDDAGKPEDMAAEFVFAGSRFVKLPGMSRNAFLGAEGDLVCVANFPGSIVDVAVLSSNADFALLYEAWTERIPPLGTKVRLTVRPKPTASANAD